MKLITQQKYLLITLLLTLNIVLSTLSSIYTQYWYAFIWILALSSSINTANIVLILSKKFYNLITSNYYTNRNTIDQHQFNTRHIAYVVPCYNENEQELTNTINSLYHQTNVDNIRKTLIVICDGKIPRNNKTALRTDQLLISKIFNHYITESYYIPKAYRCWANNLRDIEIHAGIINPKLNLIVIIKPVNIGKRDSLVLVRRLLLNYNYEVIKNTRNHLARTFLSNETIQVFNNCIASFETDKRDSGIMLAPVQIDYIIGTDADTIFTPNCTAELIKHIEIIGNDKTMGVVGYVDIELNNGKWSPLTMYQYAEYIYAQYIRRQMQSIVTRKVNCLSGCVQLLRVCDTTCGESLMAKFNYLPTKTENIFNHIRSYASEDRNHLTHIFALSPKMETLQCLNAVAYTHVPQTFTTFFRQRKRWCAGASSNDILLALNPLHNKWERINSAVNVAIFTLTPFITVATVEFIISIVTTPSILMLYLSIIMIIPLLYAVFGIPILRWDSTNIWINGYYWLSLLVYYVFGSLLNLCVYIYTFRYLDDFNWNMKTINDIKSIINKSNDNNLIRTHLQNRGAIADLKAAEFVVAKDLLLEPKELQQMIKDDVSDILNGPQYNSLKNKIRRWCAGISDWYHRAVLKDSLETLEWDTQMGANETSIGIEDLKMDTKTENYDVSSGEENDEKFVNIGTDIDFWQVSEA